MSAREIRALAGQADIGPGVTVLDLCCGVGGPGRLLTGELGCTYLGVDASASAIALARRAPRRRAVPLRRHAHPATPGRTVRRRAPARDDARVRGQGRAGARGRRDAPARRAVRLHARRGAAPHRVRAGGDSRRRHGVAYAARGAGTRITEAGRARTSRCQEDHSERAPCDRAGIGGRLGRRRRVEIAAQIGRRALDSCSPPTGCGSTGSTRGGCGSSRWSRSRCPEPECAVRV